MFLHCAKTLFRVFRDQQDSKLRAKLQQMLPHPEAAARGGAESGGHLPAPSCGRCPDPPAPVRRALTRGPVPAELPASRATAPGPRQRPPAPSEACPETHSARESAAAGAARLHGDPPPPRSSGQAPGKSLRLLPRNRKAPTTDTVSKLKGKTLHFCSRS